MMQIMMLMMLMIVMIVVHIALTQKCRKFSLVSVQFEKAMIVTLDELVAAGHGDKQYQELFAEMYV